jgi:hypothetical protein
VYARSPRSGSMPPRSYSRCAKPGAGWYSPDAGVGPTCCSIAEYKRLVERADLLEDIAAAEQHIANREGIEQEDAKQHVHSRLRR